MNAVKRQHPKKLASRLGIHSTDYKQFTLTRIHANTKKNINKKLEIKTYFEESQLLQISATNMIKPIYVTLGVEILSENKKVHQTPLPMQLTNYPS